MEKMHMSEECTFYFLLCDPKGTLNDRDRLVYRIAERVLPIVDAQTYDLCYDDDILDAAVLREKLKEHTPVQAEFVLIDAEKDSVDLLTSEQRDWFLERLRTYDGDTAELASAVLAGDELNPYRGDIVPYSAALRQIYDRLQGLLGEYTATNCFNDVPEGEPDADGLDYALRRLGEIRAEAASLTLSPKVAVRLERILDETEFFLRQYEVPGVVTRWRKLNSPIEFFDCAFDILAQEPKLFRKIQSGQIAPIGLMCCPDSEEAEERACYFAAVEQRFARENREYSEEAVFQDELCRTLEQVFHWEFGKMWDTSGV